MKTVSFATDALTDIVSNMVGVVIMLSLMTVLYQGSEAHTIEVSMSLDSLTARAPTLFFVRDDLITPIDTVGVGIDLLSLAGDGHFPLDTSVPVLGGTLTATVNEQGEVHVVPSELMTWNTIEELADANSAAGGALAKIDPGRGFAFFFVAESSDFPGFGALRAIHATSATQGLVSGWMPVDGEHPARLCHLGDGDCNYQSQSVLSP